MIGTLIILVVVVAVLAVALGRSSPPAPAGARRRHHGAAAEPPAPPTPPPPRRRPRRRAAPAATDRRARGAVASAGGRAEPEALRRRRRRYRSRLGGVRGLFSGAVAALRSGRIDEATWESLEEALIRADVGVATTDVLLDELRAKVEAKEISGGDDLLEALGDVHPPAAPDVRRIATLRFDGTAGAARRLADRRA